MKFQIYLFVLCILASCRGTKEKRILENNPLVINLSPTSLHSSVADAIQITKVINLESTDNSTISSDYNIKRIIINAGRLYIMDGKYMSIKVFDGTGKYLYSIGSLGVNPGQFTNLQNIAFYPPHHSLWALCNTPQKITEFSLDGKILKESHIPFFASDLGFETKNKIYFFVNQNQSDASGDKNVLVTDSDLNIQQKFFNLPLKRKSGILFAGGIYTIGDELYYNPPLTRTVYSLKNDSAKAIYKVDFANGNTPDDFGEDSLDFYLANRSLLTQNFIKKDNYVGFSYSTKGDHLLSFFNIKTEKLLTTDAKLNQLDRLFNNSVFESDGQLIMLCNPDKFMDILKNNGGIIKQKYPILYEKLILRKAHDNPTLIFFTLK
ncbi:MAG TPA: 6-bladed beta-propeller [Bacteroidia bacterium]|jgi:hypothetical protein|nr:6-bladed beta-propeller [Bacteroidia bacterium]